MHPSPPWLHAAAAHSPDAYSFLGIVFSILGVQTPSLHAARTHSLKRYSFLRIFVKIPGMHAPHTAFRCMLVSLIPGIDTQSWEYMHQMTPLVVCWYQSFPETLHNSWELLPNSWECMHHTANGTLTRSRYCVPGGHIPGNDCHNAGNSFPEMSENGTLSWEFMQNTVN